MEVLESFGGYGVGLDESYRPLPSVYLAFLSIWFVSTCSWAVNTWKNRHFQVISLHSLFSELHVGGLFLLMGKFSWES